VKVGDLVRWRDLPWQVNLGIPSLVGVVLEHDPHEESLVEYRVRWTNHTGFERDWYRSDELIVVTLNEN